MSERRQAIPVVYVLGSHYECGFDVGRTFSSLIQSFLKTSGYLNEYLLPVYLTNAGKSVYDDTLAVVTSKYPEYVDEIRGTADGAEVDFYKLMLFHFDQIISNVTDQMKSEFEPSGCSTIYVKNSENHIFGHTEDAGADCLNNFYMVSAHVISDKPFGKFQVKEEKFTSLCYPGHIGGYTMNFNKHGLVFTINTLVAQHLLANKIPRHFVTRALLAAENYDQAMEILRDSDLADGFSINIFFNSSNEFYNIEMGPAVSGKSQMSMLKVVEGSNIHCNHYLRLDIEECADSYLVATKTRYQTLKKFQVPQTKLDVINMLGDMSHEEHFVFRSQEFAETKTICVGIFDFKKKIWSLYKDNPKHCEPLVELSLVMN